MKTFGKVVKYTVGALLLITIIAIVTLAFLLEPNIKIKNFEKLNPDKLTRITQTVSILDNQENLLTDELNAENKAFTPLKDINRYTLDAFISIEDKRFYAHRGIDYIRVFSAAKNDVAAWSFREGASTISQQLIKNTHLSNEKKLSRKLQEMRIARSLERKYSKDEILEMYLNILYFGNNLYGIGSASKTMFGKPVQELTLSESALLAGLINNPARYSPYTNPQNATARRNLVLHVMLQNKKITQEQYNKAISVEIQVMSDRTREKHYVDAVINQAAQILNCSEKDLYKKGLTVATHFDRTTHELSHRLLNSVSPREDVCAHVLVLENRTGKILSADGKADFSLSQMRRSPGSTVKPIIAFAPALEKRIAFPSSPILDEQTNFSGYAPSNYKDRYENWTSVENALVNSSNVAAVKLLEMSGIDYAKSFARRCGFDFAKGDAGLSLALGGMENGLTLRQIANSYQAFANDGKLIKSSYIRYIRDKNGKLLYGHDTNEVRVMSDTTAYFINKMLAKCASEGTAQRLQNSAAHICAKTGTVGDENGNTDAYCIAYTPEYTVAVWIGSPDNREPHKITGGGTPSIIARNIMLELKHDTAIDFNRPQSIKSVELDAVELSEKHRLVLADENLALRYRKTAEFPDTHLPRKKIPLNPYNGGNSKTFIPDSDFLIPLIKNYEIV